MTWCCRCAYWLLSSPRSCVTPSGTMRASPQGGHFSGQIPAQILWGLYLKCKVSSAVGLAFHLWRQPTATKSMLLWSLLGLLD
ncbi:hypothetical protein EWB00_001024 [Schistosoma japonicum]|uniref:Uncharacterized protein n=1 Tax=Schistosoma japonicum TaxID=6182 RepID=A0A4Z2CK09_SCHJA|nr:hypothetical protein EWB00_001024 [Schistosoma japonicum]